MAFVQCGLEQGSRHRSRPICRAGELPPARLPSRRERRAPSRLRGHLSNRRESATGGLPRFACGRRGPQRDRHRVERVRT